MNLAEWLAGALGVVITLAFMMLFGAGLMILAASIAFWTGVM